jgi:membrane AbrB-like protein
MPGPERTPPAPRPARAVLRTGLALGLGLAGALAGHAAGMPLPFLLGPLLACGIASMAGLPILALPFGRELGQVAVGTAIGLRFVPAVVVATAKLLPFMVLVTILTIVATTRAAVLLERLGGVPRKTAFFATAAAGLAEMAVVAQQRGADSDTVALVHLVRVTTIVSIVPFLVTLFGHPGDVAAAPIAFGDEALPIVLLLAVSAFAAFLFKPLKLPNSWLLVPAAIGAIVAGAGFGPFALPPGLLTAAQVVIGVWLGCRFRRELLGRLPRVTAAAFATTTFLILAATGIASLLSAMTDLPFATSLLAVAPAGVTEMVLTASAMHLDAATVTAFQIMRIAVVMTTILFSFRVFEAVSRRFDAARL